MSSRAGIRRLTDPVVFLLFCGQVILMAASSASSLKPVVLQCEYLRDPAGIDEIRPRLTWRVDASANNRRQSAYQILVASDAKLLAAGQADLWDSGKVDKDETVNIVYEGKPLGSRQVCFWKVKVWDQAGTASDWSEPAKWSMGLLKPEDWSSRYISYRDPSPVFKDTAALYLPPARQYRKSFSAQKNIRRATLYASALGIYEAEINGRRVGDAYFTPGWS